MLKYILLLMMISGCFNVYSQDQDHTIKGIIIVENAEVGFINIFNVTQNSGTLSEPSGEFRVRVREYDTLVFSAINFEKVQVVIDATILENKFLRVQLQEKVNELEEVIVSDTQLSGNLGYDLSNMTVLSPAASGIPMRTRPLPTVIERKLMAANAAPKPNGLLNVSLDRTLNQINGRIQMLQKARENEILAGLVDQALALLPDDFLETALNIPKEEFHNFIYYCAEDAFFRTQIKQKNVLELIKITTNKAADYIESRNGD